MLFSFNSELFWSCSELTTDTLQYIQRNIAHPLDILEYLLFTKRLHGDLHTLHTIPLYRIYLLQSTSIIVSLNYSVYIFIHLYLSFLYFRISWYYFFPLIKMKIAVPHGKLTYEILCFAKLNQKNYYIVQNYFFKKVLFFKLSSSFIFFSLFYFCASKSFFMFTKSN